MSAATSRTEKIETLDQIGLRCGTDKASKKHGYLAFYDRTLAEIRHQQVKVLEVGVFRFASVRMWAQYFANGQIFGADIRIDRDTLTPEEATRIKLLRADQGNAGILSGLGTEHGPFDVIIDDGSHRWDHQILTLRTLFPFVKPGGFFIIEDLHTSLPENWERYKGSSDITAVAYLLELSQAVCLMKEPERAAKIPDAFIRSFAASIESVIWHKSTVVIRRRADA